jgi:SecD/SecF fusion protein
MNLKSMWQWGILVIAVTFSIVLILPPKEKIRLGLDLRGGHSFTMELDKDAIAETVRERAVEGATEEEIERRITETVETADDTAVEIIRNRIDSLGTEEPVITKGSGGRIYVQIPGASEENRRKAEELMRSVAFLEFRLVSTRSAELASRLLSSGKVPSGYEMEVINGENYYVKQFSTEEGAPEADLSIFGDPPPGYACMLEKVRIDTKEAFRPIFVGRRPLLTGDTLSRADAQVDNIGRHMVTLSFNSEGTAKFAEITTKYSKDGTANKGSAEGRQLAIILDGLVYSAPVLNEPILGGNAVISGRFTHEEASILRNVLNAGAMPAPLKFIGKQFVNPTLGEDAISGASKAVVIGFIAVIAFVIFYYRYMGLIASLGLGLVLLLLPASAVVTSGFLRLFTSDATSSGGALLKLPVLTLPGIAGLLLTIGMAVDANVLIFERTREEQMRGRAPFPSIMAGYKRAFLAILDGNLTTVITAVILFIFGMGLIRGFSVMLVAGIVASMYIALVVTKMLFRATMEESRTQPMKMMSLLPVDMAIPFHKYFKKIIIALAVVIVVSLGITVTKGIYKPSSVFGVDFTGGAKITFSVDNPDNAPLAEIRKAFSDAGINNAAPQYQRSESRTFLEVKAPADYDTDGDMSERMTTALDNAPGLEGAGFTDMGIDSIGSQIGGEMRKSALIAISLSTIAMLIYITVRFEFGFALGAVTALIVDVMTTVGIFGLLGFQFDLTIVAALLTIVGYGVNDTIVLFDRIREELRTDQKSTFIEMTDRCINITLNRTVLTSLSTIIPVIALIVFTTGNIHGFAVCMLIGLVVSTITSIFVAPPVMLAWYRNRKPDLSGTT